jgi:MSHA pilin protein MshD
MTVRRSVSLIQSGATLVELIITIIIISVALTGILAVVNLSVQHSADPLLQRQAISIAESYLEEIMLLPTLDPDGSESGENRATFDDINDYHALMDTGAKDQSNTAIVGLENYTVSIEISDITLSGTSMKQIDVSVQRPGTDTITLTGYRASY